MSLAPRLGLGTVQFGTAYGVSNTVGQTTATEAARILAHAAKAGIRWLDTARSYGMAEQVLGEVLPSPHPFHLVTKTTPLTLSGWDSTAIETVLAGVATSRRLLRQPVIDTLLVHHADHLLLPGAARLWAALTTLKADGQVRRLGVSVYTEAQLSAILDRYPIDMVQLPGSVFDQRFTSDGHLRNLAARGIAVHLRSVFLQGLLLMPPAEIPAYFQPLRSHLERYHATVQAAGLSPLEAALGYACSLAGPETVLVGTNTLAQLQAILAVTSPGPAIDWQAFALDDERWINPSQWHSDR